MELTGKRNLLFTMPAFTGTGPFTISTLLGSWTAMTLYGVSLVLFITAINIIHRRWQRGLGLNILLSSATVLLFALTTADIIMQCNHTLVGVLYSTDMGSDLYFMEVGTWEQVAQETIRFTSMLIGDAMLCYRAWVVWDHRRVVVIVNIVLWLGTFVCSIGSLQVQASYTWNPLDLSLVDKLTHWSTALIVLSATQTVLGTGLIMFRVWQVDRRAAESKQGSFMPVVRIVAESGAIYTAFLVALAPIMALENDALDFMVQLESSVASIVFYLIIVRVGLRNEAQSETTKGTSGFGTSGTSGSNTSGSAGRRGVTVSHEVASRRLEEGGDDSPAVDGGDILGLNEFEKSAAWQLEAEK